MNARVSVEITHDDEVGRRGEEEKSCGELVQGIPEEVSGVSTGGKIDRNKIDGGRIGLQFNANCSVG